jgi:hypothetical protein
MATNDIARVDPATITRSTVSTVSAVPALPTRCGLR